ncbi:MAG: lactonase family protein [Thalassotalea sp.]
MSDKNQDIGNEGFLIGNISNEAGGGVNHITFDESTEKLVNKGIVAKVTKASYLALNKNNTRLYTVKADKKSGIAAFSWSEQQQLFVKEQTISIEGQGSCHIALSPDESKVAIANYGSGDLHLYSIDKNSDQLADAGYFKNSPYDTLKIHKKPRMHYINWEATGKYAYAVDLGTDEIKKIDALATDFAPETAAKLQAGDGPRHLAFHPNQSKLYLLNELSTTIVSYNINSDSGDLSQQQRISAIPENITSKNSASAIRISADGRFLYAGIRGINTLSVFKIADNGDLSFIQSHSSLGDWPRDFNFSHSQNYILVANQRSNSINVLKRDSNTGLLSNTAIALETPAPSNIALFNPLSN